MNWSLYPYFLLPAIVFWLTGGIAALLKGYWQRKSSLLFLLGTLIMLSFALLLWAEMGRAPLRTMGETRLWYAIYISVAGFFVHHRWHYHWMLSYAALMAIVFSLLIFFMPEVQNKNLAPALQSFWFVPHVSVYIISYALLAVSMIMASQRLWHMNVAETSNPDFFHRLDKMVYVGVGFLILGLVMGALWANEVWFNYWSWDPKETWAFITCIFYTLYIHLRKTNPRREKLALWLLIFAFICLLITWKGVNYLPSAKASMHSYN
ncbi:MAG: cytochrome c biogenesis protein [Mangrovibacterium sp.]